ncbi:uncharacterized protein LOC126375547 [Pectinophora gossypiella]|uniref:uncharacterized protein LOC126375547 n=1 Tax=Pectinophora gossypiella TaxID=13191 RepID=UPI00214EFEB4|nr:uncharacterized protein LOC126375547 [Pectinophora gossypiella]
MDSVLTPPSPFRYDENQLDFAVGNISEDWTKWKRAYDIYVNACELNKKSAAIQLNILLHIIGEQCREIVDQSDSKCTTVEQVLIKLDERFIKKKNVTVERHRFFKRDQKGNENIEQYVFELRKLAETCEFGNLKEELIKDRLVCGVTSKAICERLLREEDLTLKKAMEICQAAVVSRAYSQNIKEENKAVYDIQEHNPTDVGSDKLWVIRRNNYSTSQKKHGTWRGRGRSAAGGARREYNEPPRAKPPPSGAQAIAAGAGQSTLTSRYSSNGIAQCGRCGSVHKKYECPAYGKTCMRCKKLNHYARVCDVYYIEESEDQDSEASE